VPDPRTPAPAAEHLAAIAHVLTDGLALEPGDPPCIVRIRHLDDADADVEIGTRPLAPGDHPLDGLVGLEAGDDWSAVGVAATGRIHHLDGDAEPQRVRTTQLVACDGSWAVRWQPLDGGDAYDATGSAGEPGAPAGRIDDALRRCLGLLTEPPSTTTAPLWIALWLDAVVTRAATGDGRAAHDSWDAVARLHPAVPALVSDVSESISPARLVALGEALTRLRDWREVRRLVAAGTLVLPEIQPATAAWLDDGAFSRWALGGFPDAADLARATCSVLPAALTASVCDVLAGGAVPPTA
jgi:hypothetical protein